MPDYTPLRITATLQTPVIADAFLPLDGVVLYMSMCERYGPQDVSQSGRGVHDETAQVASVFFCHEAGTPQWFPACSFAQWEGTVTEDTGYWHKRLDLQHAGLLMPQRGRVVTQNGRYRSYRMPVFARHALRVVWYAVAQRARLEHLLRFVTHLGKKSSQGYGSIRTWSVVPCEADWSVLGPSGQRMRAVPQTVLPEDPGEAVLAGFRPAYWDARNQAPCLLPA
jgi:hypothetical protein